MNWNLLLVSLTACLVRCVHSQGKCNCVPRYDCEATNFLPRDAPLPPGVRGCDGDGVCCDEDSIEKKEGCGVRLFEDELGFKIFDTFADMTDVFQYPWMVAIRESKRLEGFRVDTYRGGGSLIHPQVVMTAAHRVHLVNPANLSIRAGDWDLFLENEPLPHLDRRVKEVVFHEKFNRSLLHNNIALLVLTEPFPEAENINIVCLPKHNTILLDKDCIATGWGKNSSESDGINHKILRKVELPMVPSKECETRLRKTLLGADFELHESFICAGGVKGKDTCQGDGGSPLMCPIKGDQGRYQQAGIVAWGIGCGEEHPAGYVNVALFRKWIDTKMSLLGFSTQYDYPPS